MVDFLYFDSCPNAGETWKNLENLIREGLVQKDDIQRIEVPDMETAERLRFQGSPTILVDGIDIYSGLEPDGVHYTCRVYSINGERTGVIPEEFIRRRLYELEQQQEHPPLPEDDSSSE